MNNQLTSLIIKVVFLIGVAFMGLDLKKGFATYNNITTILTLLLFGVLLAVDIYDFSTTSDVNKKHQDENAFVVLSLFIVIGIMWYKKAPNTLKAGVGLGSFLS